MGGDKSRSLYLNQRLEEEGRILPRAASSLKRNTNIKKALSNLVDLLGKQPRKSLIPPKSNSVQLLQVMANSVNAYVFGRDRWFIIFVMIGCGFFLYGLHSSNAKDSTPSRNAAPDMSAFQTKEATPDPDKIFGETEFNLMEDYSPSFFIDDYDPCTIGKCG